MKRSLYFLTATLAVLLPPRVGQAVNDPSCDPPTIGDYTGSQTACVGYDVGFHVTAYGTNLHYQWRRDVGSGWVDVPNDTHTSGAQTADLTIHSVSTWDQGNYRVRVSNGCLPNQWTPADISLTVLSPPVVTSNPTSQEPCVGDWVYFTVEASGGNLSYEWQKKNQLNGSWSDVVDGTSNGRTISGSRTAALWFMGILSSDSGDYRVIVFNPCLPTTTSQTATFNVHDKPSITSQPASQTKCQGGNVTFTVTASGTGLTYQWFKDGNPISQATGSSYSLSNLSGSDDATYTVVVGNSYGCTLQSSDAHLTVLTPPSLTVSADQTITYGQNATFTVTPANGNYTYQWRKNGVAIPGANSSTYTAVKPEVPIPPLTSHSLDVVVSCGSYWSVTSPASHLTVDRATLTAVAFDKTKWAGTANPTFNGTVTGDQGDGISANYSCSANASSAAGEYQIIPTWNASASVLANYIESRINGTLTVLSDDSDNDGMSDAWEQSKFGNLTHTGTADSDYDGRTDLQEYLDGTDPNSAADGGIL